MTRTPEQLDELIRRVQNHGNVSSWKKDPQDAGSVNLVSIMANMPKAEVPRPNLIRVRGKILDRISLPSERDSASSFFAPSFLQYIPRVVRITGGIVGSFLIVISMTVGTAVATLESVPGQTIYPLKKIVENVQLQLATTEEQKTNLQIRFANKRVDELETVLQKQKEGKISEEEAQKVVVDTVQDIQKTTEAVAEQNLTEPKVDVLNKIVTLSSKQTAVIQAAQLVSEGEVKIELDKALEVSLTTQEKAIESIEKTTGLTVEKPTVPPIVKEETKNGNSVLAEGKLTTVSPAAVSIGTAQFLLTSETKYVNITLSDLKVDVIVKITGEIRADNKTYATQVELQSMPGQTPESTDEDPDSQPEARNDDPVQQAGPTPTETVPVDPQ
jgi:hypothetical protein